MISQDKNPSPLEKMVTFFIQILFSLVSIVNTTQTAEAYKELQARVWTRTRTRNRVRVRGQRQEQYRFWRSIIGERTRGLLTHCQTPYQLQFGIRLKQNHTNITCKASCVCFQGLSLKSVAVLNVADHIKLFSIPILFITFTQNSCSVITLIIVVYSEQVPPATNEAQKQLPVI